MFLLSSASLSSTAAISSRFPTGDRHNNTDMEIDTLLEALKDFDKKVKKESSLVLDQFLCHIAKTGETLVSWCQFKSYFIFKLENVMEDFQASAPEQRGPANPNVESVPFEEMKERILKIVNEYNGIPFTIQRLCELLTEPKRNYTGTEKFLRGVEKNVMVVSCIYPTSEKNGCSGVNRMNGVMLSGNTSAFTERKVNGPGTPRPLNRQKHFMSSSLATNGLPDSTENKETNTAQGHCKSAGDASVSGIDWPLGSSVKNKHLDDEEDEGMEAEEHEVKRLKFNQDGNDEEEDEDEVDQQEGSEEEEESKPHGSAGGSEDQEPSSTQPECPVADSREAFTEREVPCGSDDSLEEPSDMDQSEQRAPAGVASSSEVREGEEPSEQVSSSSTDENASGPTSSSSSVDSPTEGDSGSGALDSESAEEEPMEQD
ncbi:serine/threonine-protein phosphatase 4 regulatory subunit 2-B-like isoform X2 [Sinocyclocheilus anshuiensis]|uniref:Serine/threonine-protein phosphatase 4 regulatory subunit 2-B-like n=1 Tax=Sinocyclocheilus anshuiensis TaxID=1608454 RepID=A0A671NV87_9TELE|nr:PREDICTED: serine/threonine-protein phosphatase 4 regulatory subunit 2-B-like isoform X2 [Sinocyclocheilus anshuiensis]